MSIKSLKKDAKIVIIGAGIFGLSTAHKLATEGYTNITILDRHMPPVPDGSSSDISRVIRFDYGDEEYMKLAYEAYKKWRGSPRYKGIFNPAEYIIVSSRNDNQPQWGDKTTSALDKNNLPWTRLKDAADARRRFPTLTGELASPNFSGYYNGQGGWADANKAVIQLRDDCLELGVSFISGPAGTVTKLNTDAQKAIKSVRTLSGSSVQGDFFVLAAGAWGSNLVPMYNSVLATAQVVGYTPLTDAEIEKYKKLPIYANSSTGWFNFPPHEDTKTLKMAVHGWGYTRKPDGNEPINVSAPPHLPPRQRANYCPVDGEERLREGLREIVPELADRPFEKVALCWYTDTPSGDFIMDYHPDYKNLFLGTAGSGHGFKFLPILGDCMSSALKKELPENLAKRWKFRTEYSHRDDAFVGDGSRGGPDRRELTAVERSDLSEKLKAKL